MSIKKKNEVEKWVLEKFFQSLIREELEEEKKHVYEDNKVSVTEIVYPCIRRGFFLRRLGNYYFDLESIIRTWIGRKLHETQMFELHELELEWGTYDVYLSDGTKMRLSRGFKLKLYDKGEVDVSELKVGDVLEGDKEVVKVDYRGIVGRVDEYEKGILIDKKTVRNIPDKILEHHKTQLEYYTVLLEKNKYPVLTCGIVYINVASSEVRVYLLDRIRDRSVIEYEMLERRDKLIDSLREDKIPERHISWLCKYCPFFKICFMPDDEIKELLQHT